MKSPNNSSYNTFTNDGVNFSFPTLALSLAGKASTVSYSDMIDHVVLSNEMNQYYMSNSATVLSGVTSLVSSYASTTTDHYPIFTRYAFDAAILPVKLTSFTANKKVTVVELNWNTSQENNSKGFVIERSVDGRNFQNIGEVAAKGNTNFSTNYAFIDVQPNTGINYYRLKMVDKDGKSEFSKIIKINFGKQFYHSISPNPTSSYINLVVENMQGDATVQLIDLNGRILLQKQIAGSVSQKVILPVTNLTKGMYILKLITAKSTYSDKVLIE